MRELRAGGRSIVFISHKLKEVQAIADTITVIRRGKVVGERPPTATDAELAALMVGRPVQLRVSKGRPARRGRAGRPATSRVRRRARDTAAVDDVSFQVRAGEILGVAGRAGQRADRALRGADGPAARRRDRACWTAATSATPAPGTGCAPGIGYIPEDRQEDGLVGDFSVADNLILDVYDRPPYASGHRAGPGRDPDNAVSPGRRVRRPDHLHRHAESAPCPAATSRRSSWPARWAGRSRCCWPASRPAASTSDRSSSCTAASSSSGTRAWRWSSSPRSSTRSTRSPTASRSCTRARSPASGRRRARWRNSAC